MEFRQFVDRHVAVVEPLERESALAYWEAARTGSEEDFKRYSALRLKLEKIYTNREDFRFVKGVKESGTIKDAELARTAELLYLSYLGNQIDSLLLRRIVELGAQVENKFSVFRAEVDGETLTVNDVYRVLQEEKDSERRRRVWEASKRVGRIVLPDLIELVGLRNEAARTIGFDNYHTMSLALAEQSDGELTELFAELDDLTREPFLSLKRELDEILAGEYGIRPDEIRPWHYHDPFFQEAPRTDELNIDGYYAGRDIAGIAARFYGSIDMPVDDILARSDLYEREGKNPHAFCTDIDRNGDIRILANIKDNGNWMDTILHELGHGVFDKYIDRSLPYLLRRYPHLCTTEASAMFFGRLAQDPSWMQAALGLGDDEVGRISIRIREHMRLRQLIFARWCQTMFHFERELYGNPDRDLNALWWDIVEHYQFVRRPPGRNEPDWAAKIHIVTSPVYYHNYMLGELIASQLYHYVTTEVLGSTGEDHCLYGETAVGRFFREAVFSPGAIVPWNEHVALVTGEPLTAKCFVQQFIEERD